MKITTALAVTFFGVAGAAQAATETYDFTGYQPGTYKSAYEFTSDMGNTVTVTMGTYVGDDYISDGSDGGGYVGQWTNWGLGVCTYSNGCDDEHYVDGYYRDGPNEYLKFSFGYDVVVESIAFLDYNYGNGEFELTDSTGYDYTELEYSPDYGVGTWNGSIDAEGSMFFIGAYAGQGFKVRSLTVSYGTTEVPLPASALLLLGGLGGMATLRRRRK